MNRQLLAVAMGILCLLATVQLPAQGTVFAPGYLGQRNILSLEMELFPALGGLDTPIDRNGEPSEGISFNTTFNLGFTRVVSKNKIRGLVLEYFREQFGTSASGTGDFFWGRAVGIGYQVQLFPFSRKGILAPLGTYTTFKLPVVSLINLYRSDRGSPTVIEETFRTVMFSGALGIGRKSILNDKYVVDIGFQYAYRIALPTEEIENVLLDRLKYRDLANLHLGLGYLF